jgi:cytochrome c oxidase subunit II
VPIHLRMTAEEAGSSDNAVIHSYWVPALAGKQDVVPGRITTLNMQADETGVFPGMCGEYCGLSHANMRNYATVVTQEEFDAWLQEQSQPAPEPAEGSLAARGKELFSQSYPVEGLGDRACISCHAINDEGANVGPNLTHLMSREMFAGAIFDLYQTEGAWGTWTEEPNTEDLKAWVMNAPEMKAMRATGENAVGMPNMGLSSDEADAIVAYLLTLE